MNGDDAWQNTDPNPSNGSVSIPTGDPNLGGNEDPYGIPPSPGRARTPPRRSRSRSRSPRPAQRSDGGHNPGNNLHVSGLSSKIDQRELESLFSKYGRVQKASVMYDPHTRDSRGFGFVTMETSDEADACVAAFNGTEIMGRTLSVEKARRGRARTPTPGRYFGPPKRRGEERPYDPRPYDSRYSRGYDDDRRGARPRYDDRYPPRDYDRGYRDYDRGYDRRQYEDRPRFEDRPRYEDRPPRY